MGKRYCLIKEITKPKKHNLTWGYFKSLEFAKIALEQAQTKEPNETFKIYIMEYKEVEI